MEILFRPFLAEDAEAVSHVIGRSLLELNIKDYALEDLKEFVEYYSPETVLELAQEGQTYVLVDGETIVGCGSVVPLADQPGTSEIRAVFLLPEYAGQGLGRDLMAVLEADPIYTKSDRIIISASITAHPFYAKLGYTYVGGVPVCEDNDHYWMEGFPKK